MPKEHKVRQGECISSIAHKYGLFAEKIWNHPNNAKLKERRKDPNILYPGDLVFVPDKEEKQESCTTEQRHRFRRKGVPSKLCLVLKQEGEPRANESYILEIDGELISGTTDGEGKLEHPISPSSRKGKLMVGERQEAYQLNLGYIDSIDEISGVQARLRNLGFYVGKIDGILDAKTKAAIRFFQEEHQLSVTGEPDQPTQQKLKEIYGC